MKFGVCITPEQHKEIGCAARVGFDYIECRFNFFARGDEDSYADFLQQLEKNGIPCESVNCLIPGDLPPVGPNVDEEGLRAFLETGFRKASAAGVKTAVFGSGGARSVPDGWPYAEAFRQLGHFLGDIASPAAEKYGITVVTEPLRPQECNMINTLNEGVMLSVLSGKENIRALADIYHMMYAGDTYENLRSLKGSIAHGHISYPTFEGRTFMKSMDEYDYKGFIDALRFAGCPRCSIEASTKDFQNDAPAAIAVLRSL